MRWQKLPYAQLGEYGDVGNQNQAILLIQDYAFMGPLLHDLCFIANKARFGEMMLIKKTQKALLSNNMRIYCYRSSESLDLFFKGFKCLLARLAILGCRFSSRDLNISFEEEAYLLTGIHICCTETSTASFSDATVYAFLSTQPQGSQLVHEDLEQIHDDDLEEMDLKWNMALLSMRARKFYQRNWRKIIMRK
ncbi:hypothetical protein Tco_1541271 [Tanacetum coccineum]